ncbi:MAG: ACT domain-containing protein [Candidatus Nezhaarchaeota archaeon]|nr:ACT domain-containing protein [Candidatus Nezhaarchaeota archaeon]
MPRRYAFIAAYGRDRPGLIAGVASTIAEAGGNIEDLDEVVMRGVFVMSLLVSLEGSASLGELRQRLSSKGRELGLRIEVYDPVAEGWMDEGGGDSSRVR